MNTLDYCAKVCYFHKLWGGKVHKDRTALYLQISKNESEEPLYRVTQRMATKGEREVEQSL